MRAKIWGCRGSLAAPGPETVKYGGNTPCVEVDLDDGTLIVLDAGTGIRPLGVDLEKRKPKVIHLLLSHLHMDHLQGLGFFYPLRDPDIEMHVWGPTSSLLSLEQLIERYLSPPLFPIQLGDLASSVIYHDNPDGEWEIGAARIMAQPVTHQGPTVGYRIRENGKTLVYIPDHEPGRGVDLLSRSPEWISGFGLAQQADVLLHDAQYTEEEYVERMGWGHSSITHAVMFAKISGVQKLVLFHHDPLHSDRQLESLLDWARELWGDDTHPAPELAYEGMEIDLSSHC